ncbi:hypothetical protein BGZ68_003857 [Mortierella alpina]|nr:hypothetical protein BGZ68_003857 [Mortierella alpina]
MGSDAIESLGQRTSSTRTDETSALMFETTCQSSDQVLSVLQPPAEIPTCLPTGPASLSDSTALMSDNVRQIILEKQQEDLGQELELMEEQDPHVVEGVEVEQDTSESSLAFMTSPDSSPLPAPTQTTSTPEPVSSLKSSHSSSPPAEGVRRVTFSPDVVDNSEKRSPLGRVRRKTKKNSNTTAKANALTQDPVYESKDDSDLETVRAQESPAAKTQDDQAVDSDEAEFAEALSEFPEPAAEIKYEDKRAVGVDEDAFMTMEHLLEQESLWQTAVELFLEELNSTQIKVAVMLVFLTVYVSGIFSSVL